MNPTMRMDYVNLTSMYSPVRGNQITRLSYETRHSLFSCPFLSVNGKVHIVDGID